MKRQCPVCTSIDNIIIFHDHNRREGYTELEWDYVQCTNCSMYYLANIPSFDEMWGKYEDIYVEPDITKLRAKCQKNRQKNKKKILDIGCNHGTQLIPYVNKWWDVFGIDLNNRAIIDCQKYLPKENFAVTTIEESSFIEESFHRIQTFHVLEHVYNPRFFLSKCYELLKKDGELEIRIPHGWSLEMKVWWKYSSQSWVPFHINMFNKKTITKLLEWIGFRDIIVRTNPIPWWWILSFRQWKWTINKRRWVTNFNQNMMHILIQIILFPILWIVAKLWYGEELHIFAKK